MGRTVKDLKIGESALVLRIEFDDAKKHRLTDMGITPLTRIKKRRVAPMGDPVEIEIRGYALSLRESDCEHILLLDIEDESRFLEFEHETTRAYYEKGLALINKLKPDPKTDEVEHERAAFVTKKLIFDSISYDSCGGCNRCNRGKKKQKPDTDEPAIKLALVGNPNCGKTSLFNALTGATEYVGNRPGVTVEKKEGLIKPQKGVDTYGHEMTLVDLPGIYSLSPHSMEEIVARKFVIEEKPDAIINIVDGTNLTRNLYLTIQLLELETPMLIALNMMDEVEKNGDKIDCIALSRELGIPVMPISAKTGVGLDDLKSTASKLIGAAHTQLHRGFNLEVDDVYDDYTHYAHHQIASIIEDNAKLHKIPLHFAAIKLLEGDENAYESLNLNDEQKKRILRVTNDYKNANPLGDNETMVADIRYRFIERCIEKSVIRGAAKKMSARTEKIDKVLTDKRFAIPIFIGIMFVVFALTFSTVGGFLRDIVAHLITALSGITVSGLTAISAPIWLISLISDGIIAGVGGVLTFLPQIAILFFCLSMLEDSGYMARIAFIMDKPMKKLGLSGKSFIPLLMGFGCTVPAAMTARTMDNISDKRMTILLLPFMSCSAKLPVYAMITGAFFSKGSLWVIVSLYVFSVLLGILSAFLYRKTLFKTIDAGFMIELPPYRLPTIKNTAIHVFDEVKHFLVKAGTIIFAMSVVLWFFMSFDSGFNMVENPANSMLGTIGSFIAPIFTPNGFPFFQAAVALIVGIVAKEAVVSAFSMLYAFSVSSGSEIIRGAMGADFTAASALSFLVFVLLYTPCIAAVTTMSRELNGKKYAVIAVVYQVLVAYLASAFVYTIANLVM